MLKFLRKYQKWMLAVFCVALMVAFLVPQAAQQFTPERGERTVARTADGTPFNRGDLQRAANDLNMIRRLGLDPLPGAPLALLPTEGKDGERAMQWLLIQHAADLNKLGASNNEVFTLLANALDVQDDEALKAKAAEIDQPVGYLFEVGRQFLKAEQYRQLMLGIEYTSPATDQTGSPGLRRLDALNEAGRLAQQVAEQQAPLMGASPEQVYPLALQNVILQQGYLDRIIGHPRVSAQQIRYALQKQLTELDLTVVVLDAEDRLATVSVSDDQVRALFEEYADVLPGQGEPFPFGYREPNRVKIEALRVPIEQVRAWALGQVTSEQVRLFYDENRWQYTDEFEDPATPADGPLRRQITPEQRDEIELTLAAMRANERVAEIADRARAMLAEDGRGLKSNNGYKVLPAGFTPTPLGEVAAAIASEFGIDPEPIQIDTWVSSRQMRDEMIFTQAWVNQTPSSSVRLPDEQFGFLSPTPIRDAALAGRAGLFASFQRDLSVSQRRLVTLAEYIGAAQPFAADNAAASQIGLQVGLPGRVVEDLTGSMYVFRLTDADPAHKATDLAPIADQVREDAIKVAAYESLAAERDVLIGRAANVGVESVATGRESIKTLGAVTRRMLAFNSPPTLAGVDDTTAILEAAFERAESLSASGGAAAVNDAPAQQRLIAVELPGDFKLALVRIDAYRPLTRRAFEREALNPNTIQGVTLGDNQANAQDPLSLEALMRYTGLKWAEGEGPNEDDEAGDDADASP